MQRRQRHPYSSPIVAGHPRRLFLQLAALGLLPAGLCGGAGLAAAAGPGGKILAGPQRLRLRVNGRLRRLGVTPPETLLDALTDHLGLTATPRVCERGRCGACLVLVEGIPVQACSILALEAAELPVETREATGAAKPLTPASRSRRSLFATPVLAGLPHARILGVDTAGAAGVRGVRQVHLLKGPGSEVRWHGDPVAMVVASSRAAARAGAAAVAINFESRPHRIEAVSSGLLEEFPVQRDETTGDATAAMRAAALRIISRFSLPALSRLCTEDPVQGGVLERAWLAERTALSPASGLTPHLVAAHRDAMEVTGHHAGVQAEVRLGVDEAGLMVAWDSRSWGTAGADPEPGPPLPALLHPPHRRARHTSIPTHTPAAAPWPATGHPQAEFITMAALADAAARLRLDPLEVLRRNLVHAGELATPLAAALDTAAAMMDWKGRWHLDHDGGAPTRRGLGVAVHLWNGQPAAVPGVQMAEVAVDMASGTVHILRLVAVLTAGAGSNRTVLEDALVLGCAAVLAGERVIDPISGRLLDDRLAEALPESAGLLGEVQIHLLGGPQTPSFAAAGAPLGATAAAVSGAVAHAIGQRPVALPLSPASVITALESGAPS